jgi:tRNA(Ile)-lysidine synthase
MQKRTSEKVGAHGAFLSRVRGTIRRFRMLSPGDHVIVAVSGGADSVALLHALHELQPELKIRLTVAHLNHGLRPKAAQREAAFVEEMTRGLGIPCICETRDVRSEQTSTGACLQEAARTVRYRFLDDVRRSCAAGKLALGHTMDDQAETILMRLLRGAATGGLSGIPPVRSDGIVRPLINVRRSEVELFLQERSCDFIPDTSADEPQYLRNSIRHELLPLLSRQYNPRIVDALCTTAAHARNDEELLQQTTVQVLNDSLRHENGMVFIPVSVLLRHPLLAGRIIRSAISILQGSCRALASTHIDAIIALGQAAGSARQVPVPGGLIVRREYEDLVIGYAHDPVMPFRVQVDRLPADISLPHTDIRVRIRRMTLDSPAAFRQPPSSDTVYLAAESITLPVTIRSWQPGDRIHTLGCSAEKKIKSVFADAKIPVRLRGSIPLFECGGRIVCAGALRIAEHCRVAPACLDVIAITISGPNPA